MASGKPKFYVRVQIAEPSSGKLVVAEHGWFGAVPTVEQLTSVLDGEAWKRVLVEGMLRKVADDA